MNVITTEIIHGLQNANDSLMRVIRELEEQNHKLRTEVLYLENELANDLAKNITK